MALDTFLVIGYLNTCDHFWPNCVHLITEDKHLADLDLDGLDELEDSEDEAVLEQYRLKRIAELKRLSEKPKFGDVKEVSGQDYVQEVNKAGDNIWVVIHLYKHG